MEKIWSDHIVLRYSERTKDKEGLEANLYATKYSEKIREELDSLFASSELMYKGKLGVNNQQDILELYVNKNGWLFLMDAKSGVGITLYKIDLAIGDDEFNQQYVDRAIEHIKETTRMTEELKEEAQKHIEELDETISKNNDEIKIFRDHIKALEAANDGLRQTKDLYYSQKAMADFKLRQAVEAIVTKDAGRVLTKNQK